MKRSCIAVWSLFFLASCASRGHLYVPYVYGDLVDGFDTSLQSGYHRELGNPIVEHKDGNLSSTYSSLYNDGTRFVLPSLGEQKLLVIPVDFEESPGEKGQLPIISTAFFGQTGNNEFPSVADYYDHSSYGRLHIRGKVAEGFYRCSYSLGQLSTVQGSRKSKEALTKIYREALSWYDQTFPEDPSSNYAFSDGKGHTVVPVYLIYNAPYSGLNGEVSNRDSMMWAFTINDPAPVSWSSYSMLSVNGKVDSHTCIHESGHLFGIPDYYDISGASTNEYSPLGRADMMDCSLGDHNPFTKYLLGWVKPYIVDRNSTVTLRPFASSGDCLILGSEGENPYEEYVLLCYYTQGGLNYFDSVLRTDETMKMMPSSGIVAYKVDARLGVFPTGISSPVGFFGYESDLSGRSIGLFANNSYGRSVEGGYASSALVRMLSSDHGDVIPSHFVASNQTKTVVQGETEIHLQDVIFGVGEGIGTAPLTSLSFPSGKKLSATFKVGKLNPTYAEIAVKK